MSEEIRIIPKVIVIPKREIVRHSNRFIVYLPSDYNEIWEELKKQKKKVRVYVEVIS